MIQGTEHSGVHLIASAYSQSSELNLTRLKSGLENNIIKSILTNSDQFIIVRITFNLDLDEFNYNLSSRTLSENKSKSLIRTIKHGDSLIEFILPINFWLANLYDIKPENYKGLLEGIIGSLKNKSEQFDSHLNNTLFIFENISWSNIIELHKICGINISGSTKSNHAFFGVQLNIIYP